MRVLLACIEEQCVVAGSCRHDGKQSKQTRGTDAAPCAFLLDSMCGRLCRWLRCCPLLQMDVAVS